MAVVLWAVVAMANVSYGVFYMTPTVISCVVGVWLARHTRRLSIAVDFTMGAGFFAICAATYTRGGESMSPSYWFIALPMVTSALGFRWRSVFWLVASCIFVIVMVLMQRAGHTFPPRDMSPRDAVFGDAAVMIVFFVTAFVGFAMSNSIRRRAMSELASANEELRVARDLALASAQAKVAFMNNVSHELRTPLAGIIGTTELLGRGRMSEDQSHLVDVMRKSEHSLLAVVNSLLDYTKFEDGRASLDLEPADAGVLTEEVAALFAVNAADKGVALACRVASEVPEIINIDREAVRQVLSNLLHNALTWTEVGSVTLQLIWVNGTDLSGCLLWEIRDTGSGIPEEKQEAIFEPFEQVDGSLTRAHGGTGLGLATCRRLADLMGGTVDVESTVGVGSCFRLVVPTEAVDVSPDGSDTDQPLDGKTVCIADRIDVRFEAISDAARRLGAQAVSLDPPIEFW